MEFRDNRVSLWAEPGKHGLVGPDLSLPKDILAWMCSRAAGWDGVFPQGARSGSWGPANERRARRFLRGAAFEPSWNFSRSIDTADVPHVAWDDLPDVLLGHAKETLGDVDPSPAGLSVGDWTSEAPFLLVGRAEYSSGWTLGGEDLVAVLDRARSVQGQLVLPVAERDVAALPALWGLAWDTFCSSLVLIVGRHVVAREATRLGFHAACLLASPEDEWDGSWIAVESVELAEMLHHRYQVLGPGPADVALNKDFSRLLGDENSIWCID